MEEREFEKLGRAIIVGNERPGILEIISNHLEAHVQLVNIDDALSFPELPKPKFPEVKLADVSEPLKVDHPYKKPKKDKSKLKRYSSYWNKKQYI